MRSRALRLVLALLVALAPVAAALHAVSHAAGPQVAARTAGDLQRTPRLDVHKHDQPGQLCVLCLAFAGGGVALVSAALPLGAEAPAQPFTASLPVGVRAPPAVPYASRAPPRAVSPV